uniref:Uncharacterized protein n=1 Tax=Kalanchoe fedtschenkoi TaxID=63787 RepID=A0A7N0UMI3_KALFE
MVHFLSSTFYFHSAPSAHYCLFLHHLLIKKLHLIYCTHQFPSRRLLSSPELWGDMGSEAPSWADQWGSGGIGAMEDGADDGNKTHKDDGKKKKGSETKGGGLFKAKAAAVAGANKLKTGTTMGFKWVKNRCQKKPSSPK